MRTLIGSGIAGVVLFAWGMVFWMMLSPFFGGMHMLTMSQEQTLSSAMSGSLGAPGAYFVPSAGMVGTQEERDALTKRHLDGPIGLVIFRPDGATPMGPLTMLKGLAINLCPRCWWA